MREEAVSRVVLDAAFAVHTRLGPGLLESAYEHCLCHELDKRGAAFERQVPVPIEYDGVRIDSAFKADVIVERRVVIELKTVEKILPVHESQLLTYLKLLDVPVGLLLNFNVPLLKDGIVRRVL